MDGSHIKLVQTVIDILMNGFEAIYICLNRDKKPNSLGKLDQTVIRPNSY